MLVYQRAGALQGQRNGFFDERAFRAADARAMAALAPLGFRPLESRASQLARFDAAPLDGWHVEPGSTASMVAVHALVELLISVPGG